MQLVCIVLLFTLFGSNANALERQKLVKRDFTTWPKAELRAFGCFLEKDFGYKDKRFNCALKRYKNSGDPCVKTEEYYEGVEFPQDKVRAVDHRFSQIELKWEHGNLQSVAVTIDKKMTEKEVRRSFKLPPEASIQACSKTQTCIIVDGFDHIGAGEIDCGASS